MVALTAPRNTPAMVGDIRNPPVKAATRLFQGGMVQIDATGHAVPATATAANVTIGRADAPADNTAGANAAINAKARRGIFRYGNSAAGDLITRTEIGKPCYVIDDQTVAKTSNAAARPVAGTVFDVDAQGVWVEFG